MLWRNWWKLVRQLKGACARKRTFLWMIVCLMGMTVRTDMLGVSSIVRALGLCRPATIGFWTFFTARRFASIRLHDSGVAWSSNNQA